MKKIATLALISSAAFANGAAAPAATTTAAATTKKAGAPKAEDRVAPMFTEIVSDIKPPVSARPGQKSELAKMLEKLEVGQSIGLTNKTKKQISSTISKVNNAKENQRNKVGADGNPVMKNGEAIKDANGAVISYKQVPDTERVKEFSAYDVDPKNDPHKATVRIFRDK